MLPLRDGRSATFSGGSELLSERPEEFDEDLA
jgi:hypothetical protein